MFFKTLLATTTVALFAVQAVAAPSVMTSNEVATDNTARAVQIAPNAISACNCPNNCRHRVGDSCKFYKEGYVVTASK